MMERYANARNRNIYEAWREGGKFEGEKVTDERLLRFMKKRRDEYARDDPEWDEWNNQLIQTRATVIKERVDMDYRMGDATAGEVARTYRMLANRMPKDSSYYRNMMMAVGQMEQAARAASAGASRQFDYEGMQERLNNIYQRKIKPADDMMYALNEYAKAAGYISGSETVWDVGTLEAEDFEGIMNGFVDSPEYPAFRRGLRLLYPDISNQPLSLDLLDRLSATAKGGLRDRIRVMRDAPFDQTSNILGEKKKIAAYTKMATLDTRLDAFDMYAKLMDDVLPSKDGSQSPDEWLASDPDSVQTLQKIRRMLMRTGQTTEAGMVLREIQAIGGDVEAVQGTNAQSLAEYMNPNWQGANLEQRARVTRTNQNAINLLQAGQAVLIRDSQPPTEAQASLMPNGIEQNWHVDPMPVVNGRPQLLDDAQFTIPRYADSGSFVGAGGVVSHGGYAYSEVIRGLPIFDTRTGADGKPFEVLVGYKGEYDNTPIFKIRNETTGELRVTHYDGFAEAGMELRLDEGDGVLRPYDTTGELATGVGGALGDIGLRTPSYLLDKTKQALNEYDPEADAKAEARLANGGFTPLTPEEKAATQGYGTELSGGIFGPSKSSKPYVKLNPTPEQLKHAAEIGLIRPDVAVEDLSGIELAGLRESMAGPLQDRPTPEERQAEAVWQGQTTRQQLTDILGQVSSGPLSYASSTMAVIAHGAPGTQTKFTNTDLVRLMSSEPGMDEDRLLDAAQEVNEADDLKFETSLLRKSLRGLDTEQPGVVAAIDSARTAYEQDQQDSVTSAYNEFARRYGLQSVDEEGNPLPVPAGWDRRAFAAARGLGPRVSGTMGLGMAGGFESTQARAGVTPDTPPLGVDQLPVGLPMVGPRGVGPRQYDMKVPNVNVPIPPAETAAWSPHDIAAPIRPARPATPVVGARGVGKMPSWYKPSPIPAPPSVGSLQRTLATIPRATPMATPKLPDWSPNDIGGYTPPKTPRIIGGYVPPAPSRSGNIFDDIANFFKW